MLEAGYIHDNLQTRMLSGVPEPVGDVTDEMLEQAKESLREGFVFFGLSERFDESLVLARRRLGLDTILSRSARKRRLSHKASGRINTGRPRGDDVPEALVRSAERANRYDLDLYRHAVELFDSAPEREELDFKVEFAALQAAKGEGELDTGAPPPEGFEDKEAWRMLLEARATLLRREFELAEHARLNDELRERAAELQAAVPGGREPERPAKRTAGASGSDRSTPPQKPRGERSGAAGLVSGMDQIVLQVRATRQSRHVTVEMRRPSTELAKCSRDG